MSRDKEIYEARRWFDTAMEDLEAARVIMDKGKFSHACFFAQQAGEKATKLNFQTLSSVAGWRNL